MPPRDTLAFDASQLTELARQIRIDCIQMVAAANSGHEGGPFGMADVYAVLYGAVLAHRPQEPFWEGRDRLILSCGHTVPVRYAAMAETGYFPREDLLTFRQLGSRLQGHPDRVLFPEMETSSGPLGQGLSQAIGFALAARLDAAPWHTYAILSDGEHQEGQTWEAIMYAGSRRITNLTVILDRNHIQIDGPTETVLPLEPLAEKYRAYNWQVEEVDGHDLTAIQAACQQAATNDRPTCIIAHTIPGKGVNFMENDYHWHSKPLTPELTAEALRQLGSSPA